MHDISLHERKKENSASGSRGKCTNSEGTNNLGKAEVNRSNKRRPCFNSSVLAEYPNVTPE